MEALTRGTTTDPTIANMLHDLPNIADDILQRIPRLEGVRAIVRAQQPVTRPDNVALARADEASRLLQAIREYDALTAQGYPPNNALAVMRKNTIHAPRVLDAIREIVSSSTSGKIREIDVSHLRPGQLLAADIRSRRGMLLVKNGHVLTAELLTRIRNFEKLGGLESQPMIFTED